MSSDEPEKLRPQRWDKAFSEAMTDEDVDRLLSTEPFDGIDASKFPASTPLRGILKNDARLVPCQKGDIVVREGDWGNSAFFILSGSMRVELEPPATSFSAAMLGRLETKRKTLFESIAQLWSNSPHSEVRERRAGEESRIGSRGTGDSTRIYLQDVGAVLDQYKTATIDAGQFFGEIAALGRTQRVATVFADSESELLEIRWQGLRDLMRRDLALRNHIEEKFRERAMSSFLRSAPMFSHLSEEEMVQIVARANFDTFGQLDSAREVKDIAKGGNLAKEPIVAEEGHYPNGVILIRSGVARLSRKYHHGHKTVGYLTPGQFYGFDEIAEGGVPLRYSLRAIGFLAVVIVPTPVVEKYVLKRSASDSETSGVSAPPNIVASRPEQSVAGEESGISIDDDLLEFVVERRYVQGTATMIIDLDRCTRCDDCVRGCANAHNGNPRFIRHGPIHGHFMVANACMHCEDPVCMIECPTGAIHREQLEGQVVINDQTCIGCASCANNCPYDSIRMVEIRNKNGAIRLDENNKPVVQATKCDLCVDQIGGPSCQRACPHDALRRVDMTSLETIGAVVNR
jgi:Fe-S-cluster-containing dehydrogenase component/CRP-like cAMP-binding protein